MLQKFVSSSGNAHRQGRDGAVNGGGGEAFRRGIGAAWRRDSEGEQRENEEGAVDALGCENGRPEERIPVKARGGHARGRRRDFGRLPEVGDDPDRWAPPVGGSGTRARAAGPAGRRARGRARLDWAANGKARREPSPSLPPLDVDPLYDPEDDREEEIQEEVREMEMGAGDFGDDELQDHSVGTSVGALAGAASSSGTDKVYQRGPTRLPTKRPSCEVEKPTLLGVLLKDHFPGLVPVEGKEEPEVARTWAHYMAQPDFQDRENLVYANQAERVKGEFWRFFKLAKGYDGAAIERHFEASVKKSLSEIFYHACVYAVRRFYAEVKKERLEKAQCIVTHLEHEQYMQVPPHWCISHINAWKALVDSWCSPEYVETHGLLRERRLANPTECTIKGAGKASTVSEYSANAPLESYDTSVDHAKITGYVEVFEEVHGPGVDPSQHDLDVEVVVRAGGGKKHGRLVFGNGTIDPSTAPSLPHLKATSTSSSASIRSRPGARQFSQQEVAGMVE
ncbi:hypothetical protein BRADI_3g12350v3 [Brachypodium distachyon]|uniref:Uncharacterized protein n=1 Tax=Brachypodium distachyon TaxID=15368 RepID=A0A2K2CWQ3_BRADI|nr:hypothetical protein BRADI_3g12350v3 [Brachypodium distachyon]